MKKTLVAIFALVSVLNLQAQWMQISVNSDALNSIFFTSIDTGFVAGDNAKIYKTADGGGTWNNVHLGGSDISKIYFIDADTGYAVGRWGDLFKSVDKGQTWSMSTLPSGSYTGVDFINPSTGFITGQNGSGDGCILKTVDYGNTWIQQSYLTTSSISDVEAISPTLEFAAGYTFFSSYNGLIYKSIDGGNTWTSQTISLPSGEVHFDCIYFTDSLNGYIAGTSLDSIGSRSGILCRTTDGGINWSSQFFAVASYLMDIQFVNDTTGYMAGTLNGSTGCATSLVLKTIDGGNTWTHENTGPPVYGLNSLHFPNTDRGYALERCSSSGGVGSILKYDVNVNCFAYYGVSVDSATSTFTLFIDSTTSAQATSYFWDFGDGTTSTLATPVHIVNIDTVYNVCMKIFTAAGDSCQYCHLLGKNYLSNIILRDPGYTINTALFSTTGVSENTEQEIEIQIYPNPSSGSFNIILNKQPENALVNIYDTRGMKVSSYLLKNKKTTVDFSNESSGIYIIEVIDNNAIISRTKFAKK